MGDPEEVHEDQALTGLEMPAPHRFNPSIEDARLRNGTPGHRSPKRELDPDDPYDRALIDAIAAAEDRLRLPAERRGDEALGSQSFLLQCFYDDLVTLARGGLDALREITSRPTLLDLGLVFAIEGEQAPDWVTRRLAAAAVPLLTFSTNYEIPGLDPGSSHDLLPVVDFTRADFARHPPVFDDPVSFQDEEVVAIGWRLNWGGGTPDHADGADMRAESFTIGYHIRVVDYATNITLLERSKKPCELLGTLSGSKFERIGLRYQVTFTMAEIFGETQAGRAGLRRLLVTVTPEDNSGDLGEFVHLHPRGRGDPAPASGRRSASPKLGRRGGRGGGAVLARTRSARPARRGGDD